MPPEEKIGDAEANLAGLSEQERAALEEEGFEEEDPGKKAAAEEDPKPKEEDPKPKEGEEEEDLEASADPKPFVPILDEGTADDDPATALKATEDRLTAIRTELRDARAKLRSGDMETEDFDALEDALQDERDILTDKRVDLKTEAVRRQDRAEFNDQMRKKNWEFEVEKFKERNPVFKDEMYETQLRKVIASDVSQREEAKGKPYGWFIQEAAKVMAERYDIKLKGPRKVADKPAGKVREEPVKTLGDIDAGAGDGDVPRDEEFAGVDGLSGMELEMALDAMDDATAGKYLDTKRLHS